MKRLGAALALGLLLAGCVIVDDHRRGRGGGPPPWAPAHGHRAKHVYHYYPSSGVYFDVSTRTYFYPNSGSWQVAAALPPTVVIDGGEFVSLELDTDRPYLYHDEHRGKFKDKKRKPGRGSRGRPF